MNTSLTDLPALSKALGLSPRMAPPAQKPRSFGLGIACRDCGCKLNDEKVETTVMGPVERNDYLLSLADGKKWSSFRQGNVGWVICPACRTAKEKAQHDPLPPFVEKTACAKCGNEETTIKFCDGRKACSLGAVRDHLHRGCPRCGYTFVQGCKDDAAV